MRIRIICEGKTRDEHLRALQADYAARIAHFAEIQTDEIRPRGPARPGKGELTVTERRILQKAESGRRVVLDPCGSQWTSAQFARWMASSAVAGVRDLVFLLGGPDGFSQAFRERVDTTLALSSMTLTRDWARTLLLEQIYRAFTIERGYPYSR